MLFLNSFVDLGHKITIQNTVFKIFDGQQQIVWVAIVNSLILLPYILLFTPAAYFSNRYPLLKIIRVSAWIAVVCSGLIVYFYYQANYRLAFTMTLALAIQSAIYSPAKYGYIKQLMGEAKLVGANAKVQVTTIVAILSGTLIFSIIFEWLLAERHLATAPLSEASILQAIAPLGWLLVLSTILECWVAYRLPGLEAAGSPKEGFDWSAYFTGRMLKKNIGAITYRREILYSILGLSVFWSLSQMVLAAFPAYAKQHLLETNAAVIQAMLACSGVGILAGAMLVGRIAKRTLYQPLAEWQLRKQLIPVGAIGLAVSLSLVPWMDSMFAITLCFVGVGFFGAFFIVPLNAIIQSLAPPERVGSVLAGNNWVQNVSMFSFLLITIFSALAGVSAVWLFYLISAIACFGALFYLRFGLRDLLQFVIASALNRRYMLKAVKHSEFPESGAVLLLGNHISWIDWALIQLAVPRPIRYVIDRTFYDHWLLHRFLRHIGTIAISPKRSKEAIKQIHAALDLGHVVCLFPEGKISQDGELSPFKAGYELAIKDSAAKIMPFYIHGMAGSRFSRVAQPRVSIWRSLFGKRRDVQVLLGKPADKLNAEALYQSVVALQKSVHPNRETLG